MTSATVRAAIIVGLWTTGTWLYKASSKPPEAPKPVSSNRGPHQIGEAAWYGDDFHGRQTASGEAFDMYGLTAAHRDLPLGTVVRVTNLENKKAVVVRINDRGPWGIRERIIDLSYGASKRLGMVEAGIAPVRVETVHPI